MSQTIEQRAADLVANEGRFEIRTDSLVGGVIVVDTHNRNRVIAGAETRGEAEEHATHPRRPLVRAAGLMMLAWFDEQHLDRVPERTVTVTHHATPATIPAAADPEDGRATLEGMDPEDEPGDVARVDADPLAFGQLRVTAEHEAAHAVIYLLQGEPLAEINAGDDPITRPASPRMRSTFDVAAVSVAGPLVEVRHGGMDLHAAVDELAEFVAGEGIEADDDLAIFVARPELLDPAITQATLQLELFEDMHNELADALWAAPEHRLTGEDILALPLAGKWQARGRARFEDADPEDEPLSDTDVERLDDELAESARASGEARAYGESVGAAMRDVIVEDADARGLGTYALANASGIHPRRIRLLLTGKSPLRIADLVGFAIALDTTPSVLAVEAERRARGEGSDPGYSAGLPEGGQK